MKLLIGILAALLAVPGIGGAVCTAHGTAGASSTQVVAANDLPNRYYIFIQNTGTTNGMNVAIGSTNAATTSDVYLGPGAAWVMPTPPATQFTNSLPRGDVAVIQNGGSTTYAFCDY